jgi:hypothetical protein
MEWDAGAFMQIAIGIFFLLFGIGCALALFRLASALARVTSILTDANTKVIPLLTRVETTLDGVNSELAKVDEITASVGVMVKTAETTTTAVHGAVATPIKKVAGLASAVSEGIATFVSGKGKES